MPISDPEFPKCFDPYLRSAIGSAAAFRSFMQAEMADEPLFLLVRLSNLTAEEFRERVLGMPRGREVLVGPTEDSVACVTVRIPADLVLSGDWFGFWGTAASQVTLSLPVCAEPGFGQPGLQYDPDRPRSSARMIIGVIDDGCAFAHDRVRSGNLSSRVLAVWDQECRPPIEVSAARVFGRKPVDFKYGLEFWRAGGTASQPPHAHEIGIDEWIAMHTTPAGTVDEDGCYSHGGFVSLAHRATHGSHVLDVLAGRVPTSSRVSMDRQNPPSFAVGSDAVVDAATTDIVFVQIPQKGVNDASGLWLDAHVADAMRYILSCAGTATERVIVNVSYGRTTGPHDGTAILEGFMSDLAAEFDGAVNMPRLDVVLPAGNSRRAACHVAFASTQAEPRVEWTWRVPPDNTVPVTAEVWIDTALAHHMTASLFAPAPYVGKPATIQIFQDLNNTQWVLTIPPTRAEASAGQVMPAGDGPPLHGDWTITLAFAQPGVAVHAYAARTDPNMGARPGAKQSRFIDAAWELDHSAATTQGFGPPPAGPRPWVRSSGTLSGIATTESPGRIHIAAGYRIAGKGCSPYSSAGPSRGARKGPDRVLPTDETAALAGIPGAGTRSGCVFRLVGTSTASPQLARLLAGANPPSACKVNLQDEEKGCGTLDPP